MLDLFRPRVSRAPVPDYQDLGNLGEVVQWPPKPTTNLHGDDPCDAMLPVRKEPKL